MKYALLILITVMSAGVTGCVSTNLAGEKQTAERAEVKKENNLSSNEKPVMEAQNKPPVPKAIPTRTVEKSDNSVCPEPNLPCQHQDKQFDEWELSFRLPKRIVANKVYSSAPFYAVILKTYPESCSELDVDPQVEEERIKIQKDFSSRKVFAENSCANLSGVHYEFAGKKDKDGAQKLSDYIAVYAGVTEDEAGEILEIVKKDYPEAAIKKMTAYYEAIEM